MNKTLVRLYSDVHNEISRVYNKKYHQTNGDWVPIELPNDKDTILILAGDIDHGKLMPNYLNLLSTRFRYVIHVHGNHEFYGSSIGSVNNKLSNAKLNDNVYHLYDESIIIDDIKFIGGTMWSGLKHPLAPFDAKMGCNDYRMIRNGPKDIPWKRKLSTDDTVAMHHEWLGFIYEELKSYEGKTVVITHHSPWSPKDNKPISHVWHASQESLIQDLNPDFWFFGHTHEVSDQILFNTRLVANCVGYYSENTGYNDNVIEL